MMMLILNGESDDDIEGDDDDIEGDDYEIDGDDDGDESGGDGDGVKGEMFAVDVCSPFAAAFHPIALIFVLPYCISLCAMH